MAIGTILGVASAVGTVAAGAGSIASAVSQGNLNKKMMQFNHDEAELARQFNADEAEKARDFNAEQAEITRDYFSEQSVMDRRAEAGLNSAVVGTQGSSTSSGPSATGPAATGGAASVSGLQAPNYGGAVSDVIDALGNIVDVSGKIADVKSKNLHNDVDSEFLSNERRASLDKTLAETHEVIQQSVAKQLENDFTFQTFNQRLQLLEKSVTAAELDNGLKELNQYDIKNKIQNGVEQAYYLWVENNSRMFNTLLNAENFEHEWEQQRNEFRLQVERFKKDYTDMSYRYGSSETIRNSKSSGASSVRGSSFSSGLQLAGPGGLLRGSRRSLLRNLSPSFSHGSSDSDTGYGDASRDETYTNSFVNSKLGEMSVKVDALWDIVDDVNQDVKTRKSALRDLRDTLGDIESYGRFQQMVRSLRGRAFVGSDTLQVE